MHDHTDLRFKLKHLFLINNTNEQLLKIQNLLQNEFNIAVGFLLHTIKSHKINTSKNQILMKHWWEKHT